MKGIINQLKAGSANLRGYEIDIIDALLGAIKSYLNLFSILNELSTSAIVPTICNYGK